MELNTNTSYTLILTKKEALFLKQIMQNPILGSSLEIEDTNIKVMRDKFWNVLPSIPELVQ